jgi:hypothetical protein
METGHPGPRTRYRFGDWLFYSLMAAVPLLTAAVAIYPESILGLIGYLALLGAGGGWTLFFFCRHCPHYTRDEPRLKCIFFWGLPKFFQPRPGPPSLAEKLAAAAGLLVLFVFPLAWLVEDPGLLAVYLLSAGVLAAALRRWECPRCTFSDCPANRVAGGTGAPEQQG